MYFRCPKLLLRINRLLINEVFRSLPFAVQRYLVSQIIENSLAADRIGDVLLHLIEV